MGVIVSPTSLVFNTVAGAPVTPQTLMISYTGGETVAVTVESTVGWLSPSVSSGVTPFSVTITPDPTNLSSGEHSGEIVCSAGGYNETSVAVDMYVGCFISARDLTTWQDEGNNYTDCFVTIGSISLSGPGEPLVQVQHVVGYFDAVGTLGPDINGNASSGPSIPTVSILANEIGTASGPGFISLPQTVYEPPEGQVSPSATILQVRWPVNLINSTLISQLMHHLQVKISFSPENAPNTVKALALKQDQE